MSTSFAYIFILHFILVSSYYVKDAPTTTIKQGKVSGKIVKSENGRDIVAFRGIPFAKPPINDLRFKHAVPAEPWEGVFQADTNGTIFCPQVNRFNVYQGQEDCLFINVYVPSKYFGKQSGLPTMFYIHGGGFLRDSGMTPDYNPTKLLDRDVILVTSNYRLGILGFFSTGDEVSPGNLGLFDQTAALKWVQENIAAFGGDPKKVTIFGQSAGGTAVTMHLVSPHSKNLFRAAIVESGTYFGFRSIARNPRKWAKRLAMKLKCPAVGSQQLLNCLKTKSPEELAAAPGYFHIVNILPKIFAPVVENTPDGFLPCDPEKHADNITIDVPVIVGVMGEEGYYLYQTFENYYAQYTQQFVSYDLPNNFQGLHDTTGNIDNYVKAITDYYFKGVKIADTEEFKKALKQLYADLYNDEGTQRFVNVLDKQKQKYYTYKFTYRGSVCHPGYNCTNPGKRGPSHNEDLAFLFPLVPLTETDTKVSQTALDLWTNFATHLDPTIGYSPFKWLPGNLKDPQYLDIGLEPKMVPGHMSDHVDAWTEARKALQCKQPY